MAFLLVLLTLGLPLGGCSETDPTTAAVAAYGSFGSDQALKLASSFPFRSAGSAGERGAGDLIIKSLRDLGYQPIVTDFTFTDTKGSAQKSRNIAVLVPGSGFSQIRADGKTEYLDRQVVIGAHYDTPLAASQTAVTSASGTAPAATTRSVSGDEPGLEDYDGIHDNASGIGALLTIAREMKNYRYGYDVVLIAFGAGSSGQAGARYYVSQMSKSEIAATDAMYCLDSIYAGDKVYAHAGRNALKPDYQKDYDMRRKLYEATDVFYEYELYTNNNFMLYTNMSSIEVSVAGIASPVIYREWSLNDSDYLPFDVQGIPIVFFESYNYDEKSLEAMKESQNPSFGSSGGKIRGTPFDSSDYLKQILNTRTSTVSGTTSRVMTDQLTRRINNVAFIVLEATLRGPAGTAIR